MNKSEQKLTLALETGIDGGSAAILRGEETICSAQGKIDLSRSEDLLELVDKLLSNNSLSKRDIGHIAVSAAPGSATGIRIGLATAAGLKHSLAAEVMRLPILEAQAVLSPAKTKVISALYTEKTGIYYCAYRMVEGGWSAEGDILNERSADVFLDMLAREQLTAVLDQNLASRLFQNGQSRTAAERFPRYVVEGSLAEKVGRGFYRKMRLIMK